MGPNYVPTFKFFLGLKKFQGGQLFFKGWANIKILNYYIFKKKIPRSGWSKDHPALNVALHWYWLFYIVQLVSSTLSHKQN